MHSEIFIAKSNAKQTKKKRSSHYFATCNCVHIFPAKCKCDNGGEIKVSVKGSQLGAFCP